MSKAHSSRKIRAAASLCTSRGLAALCCSLYSLALGGPPGAAASYLVLGCHLEPGQPATCRGRHKTRAIARFADRRHGNTPTMLWVIPTGGTASRTQRKKLSRVRHATGSRDHVQLSHQQVRELRFRLDAKGRRSASGSAVTSTRRGKSHKTLYIEVEDLAGDSWRLAEAAQILRDGGVGVIPTDTCYTFACDLHSRKGVERILNIKNEQGRHKPLTLLCKDISSMNAYTNGIDKALFKTMKAALPGPYTFILPATNEIPRMVREHKHHKKTWKQKEIGIRLPDAPVLLDLLSQLDGPLLSGSVPSSARQADAVEGDWDDESDEHEEDDAGEQSARGAWSEDASVSGDPAAIERAWGHAVDFVVSAGILEVGGFSTIVDARGMGPVVLREGLGDPSLLASA